MDKLAEVVLSAIAKKSLDVAFDGMASIMRRLKSTISTSQFEIEKAIADHQGEVLRWSAEISFSDSPISRRMGELFVPLSIYVGQRRTCFDGGSLAERKLEDELASEARNCIVLGQPGAGKTTAVKHVCSRFLSGEPFLPYQVIIRLQLRDLNLLPATTSPEYIRRALQDLMRLRISYPADLAGDENAPARRAIRDQVVADWLNAVSALVILDGFDEITLKARRDLLIEELRRLSPQLTTASFVMTTRTGEFSTHIELVKVIEIRPFSKSQIEEFSVRWLGQDDAKRFLEQLNQSPFSDTAIRPLTLAHLCTIFEKSKRIPSKPKTIYKKIVKLLIEDWDEQKSVVRDSAYADFEADRKEDFLAHLAYELTRLFKTTTFTEEGLLKGYSVIFGNFGLGMDEAVKVVRELETHTGLFLQSARERFEFSHKSLQEYLAAEHIVKMPRIPSNMIELQIMPNELAVATAISSEPSEYLTVLVVEHFARIRTSFEFIRSFVNRLLLENPDFEETPRVGYALLILYSYYISALLQSNDQRSLFVMDRLADELDIWLTKYGTGSPSLSSTSISIERRPLIPLKGIKFGFSNERGKRRRSFGRLISLCCRPNCGSAQPCLQQLESMKLPLRVSKGSSPKHRVAPA